MPKITLKTIQRLSLSTLLALFLVACSTSSNTTATTSDPVVSEPTTPDPTVPNPDPSTDPIPDPTPDPTLTPVPTPDPTTPDPTIPTPPVATDPIPLPVNLKTVSYTSSSDIFLNPERGWKIGLQIMQHWSFADLRSQGYTVVHGYIRLSDYKYSAISSTYLTQIRSKLDQIRAAGLKIVPRFYYAWNIGESDASLSRILSHITQLKSIFTDYQVIIMTVQAGFVGAWGEWHNSTNKLDDNGYNEQQIVNALLAAIPASRTLQLRYVNDIIRMYPTALSSTIAFNGGAQSRVGNYNDCFVSNFHDGGTWAWDGTARTTQQNYMAQTTKYVPQGGESCQVTPDPPSRPGCVSAQADLQRFHWSYISNTWYTNTLDRWKNEGCYNTIARRLGYRLRLVSAAVPDTLTVGGRLQMSFVVINDGYAAPINWRPTQIVLRNRTSKTNYSVSVSTDTRRWALGQNTTVNVDSALPSGLPAGTYDLYLNMPDAASGLSKRPEFSVRLANSSVWESTTGYNSLQASTIVK